MTVAIATGGECGGKHLGYDLFGGIRDSTAPVVTECYFEVGVYADFNIPKSFLNQRQKSREVFDMLSHQIAADHVSNVWVADSFKEVNLFAVVCLNKASAVGARGCIVAQKCAISHL